MERMRPTRGSARTVLADRTGSTGATSRSQVWAALPRVTARAGPPVRVQGVRQASCRRDASPWRPVPENRGRGAPTSGTAYAEGRAPPPPARALSTPTVADGVEGVVVPTLSLLAAVVVAYLTATLLAVLVRRLARRSAVAADLTRRSRKPMRAVLLVVAVWIALRLSTDPADWTPDRRARPAHRAHHHRGVADRQPRVRARGRRAAAVPDRRRRQPARPPRPHPGAGAAPHHRRDPRALRDRRRSC